MLYILTLTLNLSIRCKLYPFIKIESLLFRFLQRSTWFYVHINSYNVIKDYRRYTSKSKK